MELVDATEDAPKAKFVLNPVRPPAIAKKGDVPISVEIRGAGVAG